MNGALVFSPKSPPDGTEVLWRYSDPYRPYPGDQPDLDWYEVVRNTPCGVWVKTAGRDRFVLSHDRGAKKRWAYPTKELALESYIARKRKSIHFTQSKLDVQEALLIEALKIRNGPISCANPFCELDGADCPSCQKSGVTA